MHDMSLGAPVSVGEYTGPLLKGKPLHSGSCEDGVYGCRMCNSAARALSDEELKSIGWPATSFCDWCKREVSVREISGIRPWDESGTYYEVCTDCYDRYRQGEREEALQWARLNCRRCRHGSFDDCDFDGCEHHARNRSL